MGAQRGLGIEQAAVIEQQAPHHGDDRRSDHYLGKPGGGTEADLAPGDPALDGGGEGGRSATDRLAMVDLDEVANPRRLGGRLRAHPAA